MLCHLVEGHALLGISHEYFLYEVLGAVRHVLPGIVIVEAVFTCFNLLE